MRIDQISHPAVRETAKLFELDDGFEIVHTADLPARSGLGSSSSFTVGLLHAFHTLVGDPIEKRALAEKAIFVEQNLIGEAVGSQDQVAAAFGGFNSIKFDDDGFSVSPLFSKPQFADKLNDCLLLVFTGFTRTASEIAADQIARTGENSALLREMIAVTESALQAFHAGDELLEGFGALLDEQWRLKRRMTSRISSEEIDSIYSKALNSGALGGKLLGAGGGGFMLLFAFPDSHNRIKAALSDKMFVPFRFESEGSTVVYYSV